MARKKPPIDNPVPEDDEVFGVEDDYEAKTIATAGEVWQFDELPVPLSLEEQLFVRSYIIDRNPVAALRRIGFSTQTHQTLKNRANQFLAKAEVAEAVEYLAKRVMEKLDITVEKVQRQIAAIAFFDPREIMQFDAGGVRLLNSRFWTAEQAAALQSIEMGQYGIKLKVYDRLRAAELLAKQLGVQPDESDAAQAARMAADEALSRIGGVMARLLPDAKEDIAERTDEAMRRLN